MILVVERVWTDSTVVILLKRGVLLEMWRPTTTASSSGREACQKRLGEERQIGMDTTSRPPEGTASSVRGLDWLGSARVVDGPSSGIGRCLRGRSERSRSGRGRSDTGGRGQVFHFPLRWHYRMMLALGCDAKSSEGR